MAEDESRVRAGKALARDLRAIRKDREVEVKDVLDATRLADDVIKQFELTALLDNPVFNRVYLRSLVSSYADVVDINVDEALEALDHALAGEYSGSLASRYLQEGSPDSQDDSGDKDPGAASDAGDEPADAAGDTKDPAAGEGAIDEVEEGALDTPGISQTPGGSIGNVINDTDEAEESHAPLSRNIAFASKRKTFLLPNTRGLWVAVIAAVIFIVLIWFSVSWIVGIPDSTEKTPETAPDTLEAVEETGPDPIVLPDTFDVHVIALTEPLDPIRSTVDDDLRRPYWVEQGDTITFQVTDRIVLQREVDHAMILLESYLPPNDWVNADDEFVVVRSRAQAWLDSLVVAGTYPPAAPDSSSARPVLLSDSSRLP